MLQIYMAVRRAREAVDEPACRIELKIQLSAAESKLCQLVGEDRIDEADQKAGRKRLKLPAHEVTEPDELLDYLKEIEDSQIEESQI